MVKQQNSLVPNQDLFPTPMEPALICVHTFMAYMTSYTIAT